MKRLRLLIYEGDPKWIADNRERDDVQGTKFMGNREGRPQTITSIELNPLRMSVLELLRVLFKREGQ